MVKTVIATELLYSSSGTLNTCLAYTETIFNSKHTHIHAIPNAYYTHSEAINSHTIHKCN